MASKQHIAPERSKDADLENPDNWDFARAERRPGTKQGRAVISVAFPREELEIIAEAAEQRATTVSAFIREAALEKAAPRSRILYLTVTGTMQTQPLPAGSAIFISPLGVGIASELAPERTVAVTH